MKNTRGNIRIALTKGRLEKNALELFSKKNFDVSEIINKNRKLIFALPETNIEIVLVKASDVITYVERGVCDLGVVGKDIILEYGGKFFEILDLNFGKCRFALAVKKNIEFDGFNKFYESYSIKTIATKYTNVAREFFEKKGVNVEIIKIEGSVELAPILGLADGIVDLVETGDTLRENGLEVIEDIALISARLIANTVSLKMKKTEIEDLIYKLN